MSPLKHYQGPRLEAGALNQAPTPPTEFYAEMEATPKAAEAVDSLDQSAPPVVHELETHVYVNPDGTYSVQMLHEASGRIGEGNGEHPEMALMFAFTKLWTQIDRPRCAHCGQLLPEEGQSR